LDHGDGKNDFSDTLQERLLDKIGKSDIIILDMLFASYLLIIRRRLLML